MSFIAASYFDSTFTNKNILDLLIGVRGTTLGRAGLTIEVDGAIQLLVRTGDITRRASRSYYASTGPRSVHLL